MKKISLVPDDADEILTQLSSLRDSLYSIYGKSKTYAGDAEIAKAFAEAVNTDLTLRRQMVLDEQRQSRTGASKPKKDNLTM